MTHIKREKNTSQNKDTRWDRIRKRHGSGNSAKIKSETVKRFIEIDYVDKHQREILNGDAKPETKLDPVMVMDMRHQMFKQIPRKLPLATVAYTKTMDMCKSHNVAVEERYIENQLQQFRQHLQKQNKRNHISEKKVHSLLIDNQEIMGSLESSQHHIEDFFNAPMEAMNEVNDLFKREVERELQLMANEEVLETECSKMVKEATADCSASALTSEKILSAGSISLSHKMEDIMERFPEMRLFAKNDQTPAQTPRRETPSPLPDTDEVLQPLKENMEQNSGLHLRCVRFDEEVSVCQFQRENSTCSNTSDGIDSVISELAEEVLLELQLEEEGGGKLKTIPEIEAEGKTTEDGNICKDSEQKSLTRKDEGFENLSYQTNNEKLEIRGNIPKTFIRYLQQKEAPPSAAAQKMAHISANSTTTTETDDFSSSQEQNQIIEELFEAKSYPRIPILRKYFLKWVHFTHVEKIEREHADSHADRVRRINIFLDKIRIEKNRQRKNQKAHKAHPEEGDEAVEGTNKKDVTGNIRINKKYQNKIKIQQDIIDLQRLKLERQERIIMELKLSKLSEEAREARLELKDELKSVIRSGDAKSKAKAKCLQLIGNLRDKEDERLDKLQCKAMLMPKFLQSMQERALERSVKHEQAKQRRLQQEAEREAQKLAAEEAKRQEDEEAKRQRIEALKEKRRQEKMAKIIRERERQRYIENLRKAQDFYRRLLLKRIGMEGFKRLLHRKKENLRRCEQLRRMLYKRTYFQAWFSIYRISKARRSQKADELYERILKRRYIHLWFFFTGQERSKYNVAVDFFELKLTETTFRKWLGYTRRMRAIEETKMKQAVLHHEWHLRWKVLDCWQRLPQILQLEKETEERRQRWRMKIWELLPDYTPNRDELNINLL
ncbi:calponin homology domain-containing protein DDB_G0272472 [Stomoxys calcitrans]|uniref:calponin homology domain-containing protein DDB_G0272472 n=1 Tax=Stomoxys calcitrans TaxID=35570 RepID=UPI0027E3A698|nr:calponin homology domain-containing protein DDB_G0272472 [Stomoxys calcitrans]